MTDLTVQVLREFVEAQYRWRSHALVRAELRHAIRFAEQRASWEETRRVTLATSRPHRESRRASVAKDNARRYEATRADPEKRRAHNARRMASYYRSKAQKKDAT